MTNVKEHELDAAGLRIHAIERSGDGPAIVLMHGAGSNARSWLALIDALCGRRVIAPDLPSHGRSDTASTFDLYETAELVFTAVRPLLAEPAVFGGHSWGGKLAGCIGARHPESCRGLLLIDPSPSHAVPVDVESFVDTTFGVEMQPYPSADTAADAARVLPRYACGDEYARCALLGGLAQREDGSWSLRPTREELIGICRGVLWEDASEMLAGASRLPTLLLTASESVWQTVTNAAVYRTARHVTLEGSHWIHHDDRRGVADAVREWLDAHFPLPRTRPA